jgi:hypothetical protein
VQLVAPVVLHVSVEPDPTATTDGLAVKSSVGGGVSAGVVPESLPPPQDASEDSTSRSIATGSLDRGICTPNAFPSAMSRAFLQVVKPIITN